MLTFREAVARYTQATKPSARNVGYLNKIVNATVENDDNEKVLFGDKNAVTMKPSDVYMLAHTLYPDATNQTKNRQAITPISAVLHFLADNEFRPFIRLKRFKEPDYETRRCGSDTRELLLNNTVHYKRLLMVMIFYQGFRITECLKVEKAKIDMRTRYITLYINKVKKWKKVPMHAKVYEELVKFDIDPSDLSPLFPWTNRQSVYNWLRPLCAGLHIKFTPHMARHEFGSSLHEDAGATARDLVDVGTWTSEPSTRRYVTPSPEHSRALLNRLGASSPPSAGSQADPPTSPQPLPPLAKAS